MSNIFRIGPYTLQEDAPGSYSVHIPDGEGVMYNRSSLLEAAIDTDKYIVSGGYKKWADVNALVKSRTFIHGMDIDPELRQVIGELNSKGLHTLGSCAGHGEDGFITFEKSILSMRDKRIIKEVLNSMDIQIVRFQNAGKEKSGIARPWSMVTFRGMGETIGERPFWWR